jgi:hypothetical protein
MAVINPVPTQVTSGVMVHLWETVTEADTCAAIRPAGTEPVLSSVQVVGTLGGAEVSVEGSNNGTDWVTLNDTAGNAIAITTENGAEFSTSMVYVRPATSGGSGQTVDILISTRG